MHSMTVKLPPAYRAIIEHLIAKLPIVLGKNLYSFVLYGSAVRGDIISGVSDINILLILNESTPEAHVAIAECMRRESKIDPFIITRRGMERSIESFALKFRSIKRDYHVLFGEDPFKELDIKSDTLRFLCEQALRNLRLRTVRAYVLFGDDGAQYLKFLHNVDAKLFIDLSEALRLQGTEIPHEFSDRIAILADGFNVDGSILKDMLTLKSRKTRLSKGEIYNFHSRLFRLLDQAVHWMETQWPTL